MFRPIYNILLVLLICLSSASAQQAICDPFPPSGTPGVILLDGELPCVVRDSFFSSIIKFENVGTYEVPPPLPDITVIISYVKIDSFTNLPCGLNWRTDKQQNTFRGGETGCIEIYGTTQDASGQYPLKFWITIGIILFGTHSGEASALLQRLEDLVGPQGVDFRSWIRVREQNSTCIQIDTAGSNDLVASKPCFALASDAVKSLHYDFSVYPNPNSGSFWLDFNQESQNDNYSIWMTDITGKVIYHENYAGNTSTPVRFQNFPKGIYMLKISASQVFSTKKIVVH